MSLDAAHSPIPEAAIPSPSAADSDHRRAQVTTWAREVLADPATVVFDTETTTLFGHIIEATVLGAGDEVLMCQRIKPPVPISPEATAVHGIRDADLASAPNFAEIWPQLRTALEGRRIVAYNAAYDMAVLASELHRLHADTQPPFSGDVLVEAIHPQAAAWIDAQHVECAMLRFAEWTGIPSSSPERQWRNQPLPGGDHTSLGDCRAVWTLLRQLAAS